MVCEVCGKSDGRIVKSLKLNKVLCEKHYQQFRRYGKFLDSSSKSNREKNEIVEYEQYAELILYNKKYEEVARAIVDKEDINKLSKYRWRISCGYAVTTLKNRSTLMMHRLIMD